MSHYSRLIANSFAHVQKDMCKFFFFENTRDVQFFYFYIYDFAHVSCAKSEVTAHDSHVFLAIIHIYKHSNTCHVAYPGNIVNPTETTALIRSLCL